MFASFTPKCLKKAQPVSITLYVAQIIPLATEAVKKISAYAVKTFDTTKNIQQCVSCTKLSYFLTHPSERHCRAGSSEERKEKKKADQLFSLAIFATLRDHRFSFLFSFNPRCLCVSQRSTLFIPHIAVRKTHPTLEKQQFIHAIWYLSD